MKMAPRKRRRIDQDTFTLIMVVRSLNPFSVPVSNVVSPPNPQEEVMNDEQDSCFDAKHVASRRPNRTGKNR